MNRTENEELSAVLLDRRLLAQVEAIHLIYPVRNIESTYRSPSHNASVGGAKKSLHLVGGAIDVTFENPKDLLPAAYYARKLGILGIEADLSNHHLHLDIRTKQWYEVRKLVAGEIMKYTLDEYLQFYKEQYRT